MREKYLTKPEKLNQYSSSLSQIVRPLKIKMNLISSIHDTPIDAIVETHHQHEIEHGAITFGGSFADRTLEQ